MADAHAIVELSYLSEKRKKAATLLLSGMTSTAVGKELGVTYTSVYRWRQESRFIDYMEALRTIRDMDFQEGLEEGAKAGVHYLHTVVLDEKQRTSVRMKAAERLVDSYIKSTSLPQSDTTEVKEVIAFLDSLPEN